jgi:hypothetical protein
MFNAPAYWLGSIFAPGDFTLPAPSVASNAPRIPMCHVLLPVPVHVGPFAPFRVTVGVRRRR